MTRAIVRALVPVTLATAAAAPAQAPPAVTGQSPAPQPYPASGLLADLAGRTFGWVAADGNLGATIEFVRTASDTVTANWLFHTREGTSIRTYTFHFDGASGGWYDFIIDGKPWRMNIRFQADQDTVYDMQPGQPRAPWFTRGVDGFTWDDFFFAQGASGALPPLPDVPAAKP
ncbi:MAG TPA: hypothetical protein VL100_05480 [Croceibacterium sp.]|nr:hypothetical protein [Croceibacterium sp.]